MPLHRDIHWIGRQWAVTGLGMQLIDQKLKGFFDIEVSRLWDEALIETTRAKEWLNVADFDKGLEVARKRFPDRRRNAIAAGGDGCTDATGRIADTAGSVAVASSCRSHQLRRCLRTVPASPPVTPAVLQSLPAIATPEPIAAGTTSVAENSRCSFRAMPNSFAPGGSERRNDGILPVCHGGDSRIIPGDRNTLEPNQKAF